MSGAVLLGQKEFGKLVEPGRVLAVADGAQRYRLVINDKNSGTRYLIDTGADLSVLPKSRVTEKKLKAVDYKLYAANGSPINTYGAILVFANLGLRRQFPWIFIVADVSQAIIGADFIYNYNLLVDLRGRRLIDNSTKLFSTGKVVMSDQPSVSSIDPNIRYGQLLKEFIDLTTPTSKKPATHDIQHHIVTSGPPVFEAARRLTGEKLKAAKAEFQYMLDQGICQPSKSSWASPLHLVAKKEWRLEAVRRLSPT